MYLGLDVGGTTIKCGALDDDNKIIKIDTIETRAGEGRQIVIERIFALVGDFLDEFDVRSIGMGMPGVVNSDGVLLFSPNLPGWKNVELKHLMSEKFGMPVALDNDANVAAFAELEIGSGRDIGDFLYITLGTGVGGCVIMNSHIVRGLIGGAGEFGHMIIKADDDPADFENAYRIGTLEEYVGKDAIIRLAKQLIEDYPRSELRQYKNLDVKQISEHISQGDPAAIECFKRVGRYLGIGIISVLNLLDLRVAIIGGGISKSHAML
ncbi:MAG: ROK family protein, partial [Candidatus Kapaibacterium sp.]